MVVDDSIKFENNTFSITLKNNLRFEIQFTIVEKTETFEIKNMTMIYWTGETIADAYVYKTKETFPILRNKRTHIIQNKLIYLYTPGSLFYYTTAVTVHYCNFTSLRDVDFTEIPTTTKKITTTTKATTTTTKKATRFVPKRITLDKGMDEEIKNLYKEMINEDMLRNLDMCTTKYEVTMRYILTAITFLIIINLDQHKKEKSKGIL
ncbi:hypothetical protein RF11_02268 [Thelohanellus kitauei]|uniref:Uncharacterized protein n=1 Tax=Thelohanellus kitauei TaxID=669202 RepID=A0A0C2IDR2_THEKT|nr:hypothetical protein RF11_02268 [Thelohanellus kitauei]